MTTTWPANIPQCPIQNGFSEQRQPNTVAFTPDVGPPKVRRRSTAVGVSTAVTFRMTNAEKLNFDTFFETTLADGSLPFDWPHPVTKVVYTWCFDPKNVPQFQRATARTWAVSCNLLRLPH
jgi:hypothetical protein